MHDAAASYIAPHSASENGSDGTMYRLILREFPSLRRKSATQTAEMIWIKYITAPAYVLPKIAVPTAAIVKAGPVLLENAISRSASSRVISHLLYSSTAILPPIGKPQSSPKTNADTEEGEILNARQIGSEINDGIFVCRLMRSIVPVRTRKKKREGITWQAQISMAFEV